jgi:hypothetical protein
MSPNFKIWKLLILFHTCVDVSKFQYLEVTRFYFILYRCLQFPLISLNSQNLSPCTFWKVYSYVCGDMCDTTAFTFGLQTKMSTITYDVVYYTLVTAAKMYYYYYCYSVVLLQLLLRWGVNVSMDLRPLI